jgi:hypothetical protein
LEWKRKNDKARQSVSNTANTGEGSIDSSTTFTGVCDLTLRTISEVEQYPLCIGHSFPTKDRVLHQIAEEANLFGVRIKIKHSDSHQIHVYGVNNYCYVRANYGDTHHRWTVTKSNVRIRRTVYSPPTNTINPPTVRDQTDGVTPPPEPEGDMAGIFHGEGIVMVKIMMPPMLMQTRTRRRKTTPRRIRRFARRVPSNLGG